jgi:Flp pilus assembly protein TadD
VLHRGGLVDAARKRDWSRLPDILAYIADPESDMIFVTSLMRLLAACPDNAKWPAIRGAMKHAHPLVRYAAAAALRDDASRSSVNALLAATRDDYLLVRVTAASSLSRYDPHTFRTADRLALEKALAEYEKSLLCLPDSWSGYYNLGNRHVDRGKLDDAMTAYERAMKLRPDVVLPMVNASMVHARRGDLAHSMTLLRKAVAIAPKDATVNFNLALALAERDRLGEAEKCLRTALKTDPRMDSAAYNLGVMLCKDRPEEGLTWCRKALELVPANPKYAFTLAFYLNENGRRDEAVALLEDWTAKGRATRDMLGLLQRIKAASPSL